MLCKRHSVNTHEGLGEAISHMSCFLSLKKSRSCRRLPPPALPCRFPGRVPACVGFPERCSQELVLSSFLPPPGYVFSVETALIRISVSARCGQKRSPETKRRARPGEWTWCDHLWWGWVCMFPHPVRGDVGRLLARLLNPGPVAAGTTMWPRPWRSPPLLCAPQSRMYHIPPESLGSMSLALQ